MNHQSIVFTRDYLQSAPEREKQTRIDEIVNSFRNELYNAAKMGKQSYMYVRPQKRNGPHISFPPPPQASEVTDDELIAGLFARFPGCKIYYEEQWVNVSSDTRTLKKGIVIDWSN
jgi:hypothetical protein